MLIEQHLNSRRMVWPVLFGFSFLISACANPYADFYHDSLNGMDVTKNEKVEQVYGEPEIINGRDVNADTLRMIETGHAQIGYSSFNASEFSKSDLIRHAKDKHAAKVLLYTQYTNTLSGSMPLTLPNTQTSNTYFSGSSYGTNIGSISHYGNATTTTYGTQTTYIPYNVNRYDILATYWLKLNKEMIELGTDVQPLSSEIKRNIGSNKGVYVQAVVEDTPAFDADILIGDVIVQIGGISIDDMGSYYNAIKTLRGQEVKIRLLRNNTDITKVVRLNSPQYNNPSAHDSEAQKIRSLYNKE